MDSLSTLRNWIRESNSIVFYPDTDHRIRVFVCPAHRIPPLLRKNRNRKPLFRKILLGKCKQMCYHIRRGESTMEEMNQNGEFVPEEKSEYVPRPAWQVWAARAGLVIMLISIGLWLYHIAFPV